MNKTFKLVLFIIGGLALLLFGLYKLSTLFAPGSYPFVETYELNHSEANVIQAINKFKTDNPDFIVPKVKINNTGTFDLPGERKDSLDHWYHVYFYFKKENLIIYTWTRPVTKNKTTFAFVSINKGLSIGNWQDINHDLSSSENDRLIQIFETEILKPIQTNFGQQ